MASLTMVAGLLGFTSRATIAPACMGRLRAGLSREPPAAWLGGRPVDHRSDPSRQVHQGSGARPVWDAHAATGGLAQDERRKNHSRQNSAEPGGEALASADRPSANWRRQSSLGNSGARQQAGPAKR